MEHFIGIERKPSNIPMCWTEMATRGGEVNRSDTLSLTSTDFNFFSSVVIETMKIKEQKHNGSLALKSTNSREKHLSTAQSDRAPTGLSTYGLGAAREDHKVT